MQLLSPTRSASTAPLFAGMAHHLLVRAYFAGQLEAQLFVDDVNAPHTGLLIYNNRVHFGGKADNDQFNAEVRHYFAESFVPTRKAAGSDGILLYCLPNTWEARLDDIFSGFEIIHAPRQYYAFDDPTSVIAPSLPSGYILHVITPSLMTSNLKGLEALREEMCSERTSIEDFFVHSFGLYPVYEKEVVGWCLSEYNTGDQCEIGIAVHEPHRRKGLAVLMTQAFLAEAAQRGYKHVGWDCWARNVPSAATARKAGFTLVEDYSACVVLF